MTKINLLAIILVCSGMFYCVYWMFNRIVSILENVL